MCVYLRVWAIVSSPSLPLPPSCALSTFQQSHMYMLCKAGNPLASAFSQMYHILTRTDPFYPLPSVQYRLDYAMQEIINELATHRDLRHPERTIVFIRAFLVIADSLEKKESDIPMPMSNVTIPPSGGSARVKTKFLSSSLSEDIARKIGVENYYPE